MKIDLNAAIEFAASAHEGQTRKYNGAPYIIHPVEVMNICRYAGDVNDVEVLAAAVLHDVVEDTSYSVGDLGYHFGTRVANMVAELTDTHTKEAYPDMNRAQRKAAARDRLADASDNAQTIKLADMIANTHDIVAFDPGFARVYLCEKDALLAVLTSGSYQLRTIASASLAAGWATVGRS